MNHHLMTDEDWAVHLRQVSLGVLPPAERTPHAMASAAIRRTHVRRAVVVSAGGVGAVAAVAGMAFAFGGTAPAQTSSGSPVVVSATPTPTAAAPSATPTAVPVDSVGWPDAAYWHVRFENADPGAPGEEPIRSWDETWFGNGRPGVVDLSTGEVQQLPGDFDMPWSLTWAEVHALPTDPAALEAELRRREPALTVPGSVPGVDISADEILMVDAQHLLFGAPSSHALRDALWQVVTGLETVTTTEGVDAKGRPGAVAQVVVDGRPVRTLIYDATAHQPLEWQINYPDGAVSTFTLVESGPADEIPADLLAALGG